MMDSLLHAEGLFLHGVAPASPECGTRPEEYARWIGQNHHGSMAWLDRPPTTPFNAAAVLSGCRSVIVVGLPYYQEAPDGTPPSPGGAPAPSGRVARYAWGRDYHNALGKRLRRVVRGLREHYPNHEFRSFVDASPLSERFFAERGGLGFTARNTLTISPGWGSWFFLGEILTTLEVEPAGRIPPAGCPADCFACGRACPTGALSAPHRFDARRCISYLTIEHRGSIPVELRPLMGDHIFGCDECQDVCPLNATVEACTVTDFTTHRVGPRLELASVLDIRTDDEFGVRFNGTPLARPGRAAVIRNACIVAANTGASGLLPRLRELAGDTHPVISEHAAWAVDQLGG